MSRTVDPGTLSPLRNTVRALYTIPPFVAAHACRNRYVERRNVRVDDLTEAAPPHRPHPNLQVRDDGVGPIMMRTYHVDIMKPTVGAGDLMSEFAIDPNHFTSTLVAGFVVDDRPARNLTDGDELVVEIPGPWNGPCVIEAVDRTSVLMATLGGHMEAGHIRFSTTQSTAGSDGDYAFQIRSWARAGDPGFAALHLGVPIGKELQTAMWCAMCDRAVTISGGRRSSPIVVTTEELDDSSTGAGRR